MNDEFIMERFTLCFERIKELKADSELITPLSDYFERVSEQLFWIMETALKKDSGELNDLSFEEKQSLNAKLYEDITGDMYEKSFANPDMIQKKFAGYGLPEDYSRYLCFLYAEILGNIPCAFEKDFQQITIFAELFLEVYGMFYDARDFNKITPDSYKDNEIIQDVDVEGGCLLSVPESDDIKKALISFENDYSDLLIGDRISKTLDPSCDFALRIVMDSDLSDISYLYDYGEFISDTELNMASFLNSLPYEDIKRIADTYTEGYRIGFVKDKKPLHKKKTVNVRFPIGFERIVREAVLNFEEMNLKCVMYRYSGISLNKNSHHRIGYVSASPNKQFDFDHADDRALFWEKEHINNRLDILKKSYEANKELANTFAGPAVIETFGDEPFTPVVKKSALKLSKSQQELASRYAVESGNLTNQYILGHERSFTIIAFPIPEIGKDFEEIFKQTIKLNTLDYKLYESLQQTLINALDKASYVHVLGKGDNKTDLKINLIELSDPNTQTKFENCVADVNIPVGEVFTSPKLKGTNGTLHVLNVYLDGLLYKDLMVNFTDGCVSSYSCSNFSNKKDNEKYFKENVLFNHETLPLGEFAIGTNTTAYKMARDYGIEDRLPILIGEKTGPHFALGDTCYSRAEEVKVYNPDKKEIIAKENDFSLLRNEDPLRAYFSCHTDITIPYDEIGSIIAVCPDENIEIIKDGRFVLPGLEELNKPLNNT